MKTTQQMKCLLKSTTKELEKELGIQIRNGQARQAIRATLHWVQQCQ